MDHDWDMLGNCKRIDAMSKVFTDEMILLRDELVPKNITSKTNTPRYLNKGILKRIKKRNKMWRKYRDNPGVANEAIYKTERNEIVSEIRKAKKKFETRLADRIKVDSKAFYAYVNSKRICKDRIGPIIDMSSGKLIYEAADMVKLLNDYFATVFTKEMNVENFEIRETTLEGDSIKLTDVDITEEKILKALNSVKRNKTEGIDGLNSTLFIECKTGIIVLPLKKNFQHSIENSEIPLQWKMANVVPIFKKGSKKDVGN